MQLCSESREEHGKEQGTCSMRCVTRWRL